MLRTLLTRLVRHPITLPAVAIAVLGVGATIATRASALLIADLERLGDLKAQGTRAIMDAVNELAEVTERREYAEERLTALLAANESLRTLNRDMQTPGAWFANGIPPQGVTPAPGA